MNHLAKPLSLLLVVLALGMKPSPTNSLAGGDCLYDCEGSTCYDFSNHATFCQEIRAKCLARCSGKRWWGAIAYSRPDQKSGVSLEWNTESDAKKDALNKCSRVGTACQLWATYENSCGAVASDGVKVTWGSAFLLRGAEQRALEECRKAGGRNCVIKVGACSKM